MVHDEAHELKQNEALKVLAKYVHELRGLARTHSSLSNGNPVIEVEEILGGEKPSEELLNKVAPSGEEVKALAAMLEKQEEAERQERLDALAKKIAEAQLGLGSAKVEEADPDEDA